MDKCFCGLYHGNYESDMHALLHDAYHSIFQGDLPDKEWKEATFELLKDMSKQAQAALDVCPYCKGSGKETANKIKVRCRFCSGTGKK